MHTLYDVETQIPAFFHITEASVHDSKVMIEIPYEPSSYYIFDRGYNNFKILYKICLLYTSQLILNLSEQPHIFLHFVICGIDVRRRICLVAIQRAKNEELVGDKSTHEIFAEYKERVIQRRLIYMPLLLLMG